MAHPAGSRGFAPTRFARSPSAAARARAHAFQLRRNGDALFDLEPCSGTHMVQVMFWSDTHAPAAPGTHVSLVTACMVPAPR